MFRKNEGYKQINAFSIESRLTRKKRGLWNKSKEHLFFLEIFSKIDEGIFRELYSKKKSRPNTAVNQLVGALILKHLNNWTYDQLFTNLNFNILTRHAIGINDLEEEVFCEASLFNFQNKLCDHYALYGEDLVEKIFSALTLDQIKKFGLNTSVQRGDSFLVGSNIMDYSRLRLLIEVLKRMYNVLNQSDKELYKNELSKYLQYSLTNYVYHIKKSELSKELSEIAKVFFTLSLGISERYKDLDEYQNFQRVIKEHFDLSNNKNKIAVKDSKTLNSGALLSPDDPQATFRRKNAEICKGYVTHISETVNPQNKLNLITDISTRKNNVGDAEILKDRLPIMINRTPSLHEYFADGLYGSPQVDELTERKGIVLYQKTARGRKSSAGIKIYKNDFDQIEVSCKGGQKINSTKGTQGRYRAEFDSNICPQCPFKNECTIKKIGGKRTVSKRVLYFDSQKIATHKRLSNIEKLKGSKKHSRANVEATVKEMKRGMRNGKVRVRGWIRISHHMIMTAMAVNFSRIHKIIA